MKKSVTLVEILVASFILASALAGLLATFAAVRTYITRSNVRLAATNIARGVLNQLKVNVTAATWNTGDLAGNTSNNMNVTIEGKIYNGTYNVTNVTGRDYRQVIMNIAYNVTN